MAKRQLLRKPDSLSANDFFSQCRFAWLITTAVLLLIVTASAPAQSQLFGVAHRGGRVQGPENTLEVFQLTIDLGATPWLETDSWESSDGVLMLHHDRDLCRTTNIASLGGFDCVVAANNPFGRFPRVGDFTVAELKTLDVGSWFSADFAGAVMPTLEEAIALVDGTGVRLLVEVKTPGQAPIIAEILTRTGLSPDNLIIWARAPFAYDEFHGVIPGIRQITGIFELSSVVDSFLAERAAAGDYGIAIQAVGLTRELVERIHSFGLISYSVPTAIGQDTWLEQIPLGIAAIHVGSETEWSTFLSTRPCIDRSDNDGDGFADTEGVDFDFDGIPELLPDAACRERFSMTEVTSCQDSVDNDGDGLTDLADTSCQDVNSLTEFRSVPSISGVGFFVLGLLVIGLGTLFSRRPLAQA